MAVPTFKVEIGWSSAQAGLIVFDFTDFKTVSGVVQTADVFGNAFFSFFNGAQDDVTNDVQSIRIKRGRDGILGQINAGTCDLEMMRPSDRAYWNPSNKSSTINTSNAPAFVPMRPMRVTATYGGTTYGLFWGFIRSARFDYASGVCHISCVDLMLPMSKTNPLDPGLSTTSGGTGSDSYTPDAATASDVTTSTVTSTSQLGLARLSA